MRIYIFHTSRYIKDSVASQRAKYWANGFERELEQVILIRHGLIPGDDSSKEFFLHPSKSKKAKINTKGNITEICLPQHVRFSYKTQKGIFESWGGLATSIYSFIFRTQLYNNLNKSFKEYFPNEYFPKAGDVVISSGPPSNTHEIGRYLQKKIGVKWIMDFRDPWTFKQKSKTELLNFQQRFRDLWMRPLENKFLAFADKISTASLQIKEDLPLAIQKKTVVIPNGSDDLEIDYSKINSFPEKFSIIFSGHIYAAQLDDETFFLAFKNFVESLTSEDSKRVELHFLGDGENPLLKKMIAKYQLSKFTKLSGWVSLEEAISQMYNASMFLQLQHKGFPLVTNTKQFNYVALQKPILLSNGNSIELKRFLKKYKSAIICHNHDEVVKALNDKFNDFILGRSLKIPIEPEELRKISRSCHTEEMVKVIKSVAQSG
jgi:glycosyltransferase involved in cell wall biosynthesis